MAPTRCKNTNHFRMNINIRYCPECGELVGPNTTKKSCDSEIHSQRRKERYKFCVDCGKLLALAK